MCAEQAETGSVMDDMIMSSMERGMLWMFQVREVRHCACTHDMLHHNPGRARLLSTADRSELVNTERHEPSDVGQGIGPVLKMQLFAHDSGRCVQASDAAAIQDANNAASTASFRECGSTSPAANKIASTAPAVESVESSPDRDPTTKLPPARTSSAAEADALLADIAAAVTASEDTEAPQAHVGAPQQLQEPASGPSALSIAWVRLLWREQSTQRAGRPSQ